MSLKTCLSLQVTIIICFCLSELEWCGQVQGDDHHSRGQEEGRPNQAEGGTHAQQHRPHGGLLC